jgi:thymidylate kinase
MYTQDLYRNGDRAPDPVDSGVESRQEVDGARPRGIAGNSGGMEFDGSADDSRAGFVEKEPGEVLFAVCGVLDRAKIPYCIVHGYEGFPDARGSDIDCVVDASVGPDHLLGLLQDNQRAIGARIARANGYFITLRCKPECGVPTFLSLDFSFDCKVDDCLFYPGDKILRSRRRYRWFWVPSAGVEFHCYLARLIYKKHLDDRRTQRLSTLYGQAQSECRALLNEFWPPGRCDEFRAAASSGKWMPVQQNIRTLHKELRWHIIQRSPGRFAIGKIRFQFARLTRLFRPEGLNVVLLGPDGAGKSSVINALEKGMTGLFAHTHVRGFAPSLRQLMRRAPTRTDTPHALAPRSLLTSLVRAAYWMSYNTLGYAGVYWAKARSTLVLNDRHFVDILVDPVRYRYGGPKWLLKLIWRLMPKPDVIILLYGPPEVLQARKRELSVVETARQCHDYLALVQSLKNSHVIDAAQPLDQVVRDACGVVLHHFGQPTERFGTR